MTANGQQVVQDTSDFGKHGTNVFCTHGDFNFEELLDRQGVTLFLSHHRHVVQTIKVGQRLQVSLIFDEFLRAAMEKANMRIKLDGDFTV